MKKLLLYYFEVKILYVCCSEIESWIKCNENVLFLLLKEKTREQKEADLIPKIQEAVNYGLQVLDSAFEQLDIKAGNSDSEEEESNERVELILEPKVQRLVLAGGMGLCFALLELLFAFFSSITVKLIVHWCKIDICYLKRGLDDNI